MGVYLSNAESARDGVFGDLHAFSRKAFDTLTENLDQCSSNVDWKHKLIGEDEFAKKCLALNGVKTTAADKGELRPVCGPNVEQVSKAPVPGDLKSKKSKD